MAIRAHIICVAQMGSERVSEFVADYAKRNNISMKLTLAPVKAEDYGIISVITSSISHTSLFCRTNEASALLESILSATDGPVLYFSMYEHDYWQYELYARGVFIDSYASSSAVQNTAEGDTSLLTEKPSLLSQCWPGIDEGEIRNYFIPWQNNEYSFASPSIRVKSYDDDIYTRGDVWQLADVMHRLQLVFPISEERFVKGTVYQFLPQISSQIAYTI